MPVRDSATAIISQLEKIHGKPLNPEEADQITVWQKGRALAHIASFYGFDVVREILKDYAIGEAERLMQIDPKDSADVVAQHAVAFTANRIYLRFLEDVQRAVNSSSSTPQLVKEGLKQVSPVPPDSL